MLWFLHSFDSANLRLGFLALICSGRQDKKYLDLWSGAILG